ncbi:ADP-ribosyltransferase [Nocardia acidivorans]|uniref:ADP-ribosyltransferase n=1 Tax=Nocardia acidivorans TaxID=404580 RepID=UPI00082FED11|nr:ADP-ribosyltransferase [Nocardia acidivorans]
MVSVNPQTFYDGAKTLTDLGVDIDAATTKLVNALYGTGSMSGSSDAAKQWATSYDTRASDTIDNGRKLAQTLKYFAGLVSLAGYNHALANYNADTNPAKGAGPTKPASAEVPVELCWVGPSSAGGPGDGLLCGIAQVMEKIHVHIPDGDTDKLSKAAGAWHDFAATESIAQAAYRISGVNNTLAKIDSPEIGDLLDQLAKLKRSGHNVYKSADQLGTACENLNRPLLELRKAIETAFKELEKAIIIYLAIDILAALVTAGAGLVLSAVTAAKFAKDIDACATAVTEAVTAAKIDDALTVAAKAERVLANTGKELDDVAALEAKTIEEEVAGAGGVTTKAALTDADLRALEDYTGMGFQKLNEVLRNGTADAAQQARIKAIEDALAKLPDYNGVVYRGTNLPADVLSTYQKGEVVTEDAFTSTTSRADGTFPGDVEFEIVSKTGKNIDPYSLAQGEDEVLFPPGSNFFILDRFTDSVTGKTIIKMLER